MVSSLGFSREWKSDRPSRFARINRAVSGVTDADAWSKDLGIAS